MKICFLTNNIAEVGGVQRVLSVVANGLVEHHSVSILMTSSKELTISSCYPLDDKVEVLHSNQLVTSKYEYPFHKIFRLINRKGKEFQNVKFLQKIYFPKREMKKYNSFFENYSFDIIVGVQPRAAAVVSQLKSSAIKIGWMHNTYEAYFFSKDRYQWHQELLYKYLLSKLDQLIVLTENDREVYARNVDINDKTVKIYNPLSFSSDKVSLLNNHRLIFVGRLQFEQKGLGLLVKILSILKKEGFPFEIDIVGDGPDKTYFLREAEREGIRENLHMVGVVKNVIDYYVNADIMLLTSKYEGFGLVVTEAMECGLPVISFKTEGPSEIIENGSNGYLIEKFDIRQFAKQIIQLSENLQQRKQLGSLAKKRAEEFSIEQIIIEWTNLLNRLTRS